MPNHKHDSSPPPSMDSTLANATNNPRKRKLFSQDDPSHTPQPLYLGPAVYVCVDTSTGSHENVLGSPRRIPITIKPPDAPKKPVRRTRISA